MTYQLNFKNICSCDIKDCPLKEKTNLEEIVDIVNTSPIELIQLRINNFIHSKLETFLNDIIYSKEYFLVQTRVDFFCSEHPNFVFY